jgi:septal ring factor EnvC (AmiA/AmiB activator)
MLALRKISPARTADATATPEAAKTAPVRALKFGGLPTLSEVSPEYAALVARRDELQTEQAGLRTELGDISRAIAAAAPATDRAARAARVIDGDQASLSLADLQERRAAHQRRLADLDEGLEVLDGRVREARMTASAMIRDRIEPQHRALVRTICDRLLALHEASRAYHKFATELNDGTVAWSDLRPMFPAFLGDPGSAQSSVAIFLAEAANYGFIPAALIPAKLRR